jgi:hypothetical protein
MSQLQDPPRLSDSSGTPAELRVLLGRASSDETLPFETGAMLAAVQRRLLSDPVGVDALLGDASVQPTSAKSGTLWLRYAATRWIMGAVVALGGVAYLGAGSLHLPGKSRPILTGAKTVNLKSTAYIKGESEIAGNDGLSGEPAMQQGTVGGVRVVDEAQGISPASHASRRRAPLSIRQRSETRPSGGATATTTTPAISASSVVSEEYALLRKARQALGSNPSQSLRLTEQHQQEFPRGMLVQEREAIRIEALAGTGHAVEASNRAAQFLRQFPKSPYRGRLEGLTGVRHAESNPK